MCPFVHMWLDSNGYNQSVIVSRRVNGPPSVLETSGLPASTSFSVRCLYEINCEFQHLPLFFSCARREMDRLGILTASHQDIITASLQREMLSQMQHVQHTMVPV